MNISGRGGKRKGAGRPKNSSKFNGMPSKVIRVSQEVDVLQAQAIPELQALIQHWEDECLANPESARHYYLRKFLDELQALGF